MKLKLSYHSLLLFCKVKVEVKSCVLCVIVSELKTLRGRSSEQYLQAGSVIKTVIQLDKYPRPLCLWVKVNLHVHRGRLETFELRWFPFRVGQTGLTMAMTDIDSLC